METNFVYNARESEIIELPGETLSIPGVVYKSEDIVETREIFDSWGLSSSASELLKLYGVTSIEVLEKMEMEDVDKFFSNFDSSGYFGDRIKFQAGLRQWRKERNKTLLCDQDTLSPSSTQNVLEWLEVPYILRVMGISIVLLVLLGLLTVLYFWMKRSYSYWRNKNVPSIEPSPIFGNIQDIMLMKTNPAVHMANLYNHQNAQGQSLVGIYVFNKPAILLRDLDLIKTVMVKDFNKFSNRFASCDPHGDPLGYLNLFFIKNVQWKELRNKLTPVFTSGKLKQMYPLIAEIGTELDEHLCKITQDSTNCIKEVKEISAAFTTDVIATVAFGLRANSIQDPNSGFRKEGRELFKWTTMKSFEFLAIFFLPRLVGLFGCKTFSLKASKFIRETINYTMDERIRSGTIRNDLIDALVTIKKTARSEGEDLNNEILVAQAAVFFSAGFETTSSTISFGLYELSKAQECQKRLREEIKEKLSKSKGQITYEILQEMDYLHMVVMEVMRMYPSLPFLDRECTLAKGEEDFLLDEELNVRVPHGMPIYISTYALHRDPTYFSNPDEFDPERFSPENKANIRPMTYMPFGAGPHNCIGERLGIVQAKIGLISFLRSHYVTTCEKSHKSLVLDPKAVLLQAQGGLYCKLVRDPLFDKQ